MLEPVGSDKYFFWRREWVAALRRAHWPEGETLLIDAGCVGRAGAVSGRRLNSPASQGK
jgi:hypothetical protein